MSKSSAPVVTGMRAYKADLCDEYGHRIMILKEDGMFDCYVRRQSIDSDTPYLFMFGLPVSENTASEAMEIAIANVPLYAFLFDEN